MSKARKQTTRTARPAAAKAETVVEQPRIGSIGVGDVIDGWTVLALNGPGDVLVGNGAERRTLTIVDLERAKQAATS
jgi:hypothetical protein